MDAMDAAHTFEAPTFLNMKQQFFIKIIKKDVRIQQRVAAGMYVSTTAKVKGVVETGV